MMSRFLWIKYGVLKGMRYRMNTICWFLADVSLYASTIIMYAMLASVYDNFGSYTKKEMLFYLSTYFLVNNIYAIFFSEASSAYADSILNGTYAYYQLSPRGVLKSLILLNFNFPAFLSFPSLLVFNIYCMGFFQISAWKVIMYYTSILFSCAIMLFLFQSLLSLLLFGIRSFSLQSIVVQFFSLAEKPDTLFHPAFRKIFTYLLPAFMLSAVPTRILLGTGNSTEMIALFFGPFILGLVFAWLSHIGNKKLKISGF